ncbi:hypothetical protein [Spirosoma aerolatum]|uniref:hypothetical protein n=1 Tax=Spirosoma aerolatum TaxID=1211326 RepID=UPI0009AC0D3B|nr:hypothetical protein [Spirosoma aerolatum]
MKTICASLFFMSLSATIAPICSASPGIGQPRNNPIYSSRNYKQVYSSKWQDQSAITSTTWAHYNTRIADYKHSIAEPNLAIGSLASNASTSSLVNRNYKTQHETTWQLSPTAENHPVRKHHKHHHNTVGS